MINAEDFRGALLDIIGSIRNWRLWVWMALGDVRRRYRRTVLGPFWATGSFAIFVATLGFLYASLWNQDVEKYLPYLTTGFLVWIYISTLVTESCSNFIAAEGHLKQIKTDYTTFIFAMICRNLLVLAHHFVVFIFVAILFSLEISSTFLMAIPGLLAISLNGVWVGWVFGLLGSRYRDITQLVSSVLQILFFVTPILWPPTLTGKSREIFVEMNPFYHYLEIVRSPMLGVMPELSSWIFVSVVTTAGLAAGFVAFAWKRRQLIYWL